MKRVALATVVATALAGPAAWGHVFPPVRTVVVQVEPCSLAVLVGYRPGSGEAPNSKDDAVSAILARVATQPKSQGLSALRDVLAQYAMAPLSFTADGVALAPTSVRAKIGVEPTSGRPMIVLLVTFPLPRASRLTVASADARTTRISWQDRRSGRVPIADAPAEGRWFSGVASFLLSLDPTSGGSACASSAFVSSPPSAGSPPATSPTIPTRR